MRPAHATLLVAAPYLALRSGAQQTICAPSLEEGLPSAGTFALCEDRDGFLWVGTLRGRHAAPGFGSRRW
ncbi:MAG: hypothetical protein IPL52_18035 [Flavobacteriales bacterium]|nr:hypothetical protein [Flavobacteriales bacterium]